MFSVAVELVTPPDPDSVSTGTAYLTREIGPGSAPRAIAQGPYSVSGGVLLGEDCCRLSKVTLFNDLILLPGTYHLTLTGNGSSTAPNALWQIEGGEGQIATISLDSGVTLLDVGNGFRDDAFPGD